ncbi:hypothetical protein JOD57_000052 [Geodermatophilus bullaregiensis]|uniref:hypothetical protein n=1 Tax=Geodermatophilus bullaregiensis TaxID=1564160 RepID=UPI001956F03D|nr:hypothetical protein [Geodermatophilus bullaregiensis]MBM7804215.1 hypothetical protein [Geodermatophilus bullaregiensis]
MRQLLTKAGQALAGLEAFSNGRPPSSDGDHLDQPHRRGVMAAIEASSPARSERRISRHQHPQSAASAPSRGGTGRAAEARFSRSNRPRYAFLIAV